MSAGRKEAYRAPQVDEKISDECAKSGLLQDTYAWSCRLNELARKGCTRSHPRWNYASVIKLESEGHSGGLA